MSVDTPGLGATHVEQVHCPRTRNAALVNDSQCGCLCDTLIADLLCSLYEGLLVPPDGDPTWAHSDHYNSLGTREC